jgi:DNA primase
VSTLAGQTDIDHVRASTDLVSLIGEHVALRPRGREFVGLCPFHDDRRPSLAVVTHKGNAFYKCHACGAAGDCFTFVMEYHKRSFPEALDYLAQRAGITLRPQSRAASNDQSAARQSLRQANQLAMDFFRATLRHPQAGQAARSMIQQRRISDEMVGAFSIGAAPAQWDGLRNLIIKRGLDPAPFLAAGLLKPRKEGDGHYDSFRNRLIFPICDDLGQPIAFGGRQIDPADDPKYLNSAESPLFHKSSALYGIHVAKRAIIDSRQAIVVEGYVDAIACHQAGIGNVVATLGTALTREHARKLANLCESVVLVFDGDEAGQKAADRAVEVFFAEPVDVKIAVLPGQVDPDDLLKQPQGRTMFDQAVAAAVDALAFKVARFRRQLAEAGSATAKSVALQQFLGELASLGFNQLQGVRKRLVLGELAAMLGLSEPDIEKAMPRSRPASPRASEPAVSNPELQNDEEQAMPMFIAEPSIGGRVSPARRRAELELLAILIYQPSLHAAPIAHRGGDAAPLLSRHGAEQFVDPAARGLAELVFALLREGCEFTVQQLMGQTEDRQMRAEIARLYDEGRRVCGEDDAAAAEHLQRASDALIDRIGLESFRQTVATARQQGPSPDQPLLAEIIQKRREHGHDPLAMPRGVRSS